MNEPRRRKITKIITELKKVREDIKDVYSGEDIAASSNAAQGSLKQVESDNACLDLEEAEELLVNCIELLENAHER